MKWKPNVWRGEAVIDVPNGIITHLKRECTRNVHDRLVVAVRSESLEEETEGASPDSGLWHGRDDCGVMKAADSESG
jgi:hypothetical protein